LRSLRSHALARLLTPPRRRRFPHGNTEQDGFLATAPATHFGANDLGFYNLVGNVWEWARGGTKQERFMRGASYADGVGGHVNTAATVAARAHASEKTSSCNIGFRCATIIKRPLEAIHDDETRHADKKKRFANEL
jgi:formylglycine-generating enzyme required for sulfatase activity